MVDAGRRSLPSGQLRTGGKVQARGRLADRRNAAVRKRIRVRRVLNDDFFFGRALCETARFLFDAHRHPVLEPLDALHDDDLAALEPVGDGPAVADAVASDDAALRDRVVVRDLIDETPLAVLQDNLWA